MYTLVQNDRPTPVVGVRIAVAPTALRRRAVAASAGGLATLLLLLVSLPGLAAPPVRVGGSGWVADAPTKVADALDYFNDSAPDGAPRIEVEYHDSGKQALAALFAGELELALVATTPLAIHLSQPSRSAVEPVILTSVALSNQTHRVVASRDRGIVSADDLHGKRVGMPLGTSAEYAWSQLVALHGLELESIQVEDFAVDSLADALLEERIDAAVLWDPWASDLAVRLGPSATILSTRSLHTVNWLLVADRSWVRARPASADRVLRGFLRAVDLIYREPDRARSLHAERGPWSVDLLTRLEEAVIWNIVLDWSVLTNMHAQLTWLGAISADEGDGRTSPASYLEPAPLERVAPERLHLPPYLYRRPAPERGPPR